MSAGSLVAPLAARGLPEAEVAAARQLFETAARALAERDRTAAPHAWWVPGRVELFGKHTDYAGGRTLVCALPRGFAFLAAPRGDDQIEVVDARNGDLLVLTPGAAGFRGWRHYVEIAVSRLVRNFPNARRGATIVFASNLPRAAGMSSSSSLVVGVAASLVRLWRLEARDDWRENIRDGADLATYYACLESGVPFRGLDGDSGVGTHGGSEDHAAIVLGTPGQVSAFAFVPMRHIDNAQVPGGWHFVIASSGVASEKTGAARDRYNRLAKGAAILLDLWNRYDAPCPSLGAALRSHSSAGTRLRELIDLDDVRGWTADALQRRLAHFEIEDALVPEALRAFDRADAEALGAMSDASQHRAEVLLGNQIDETIALARLARGGGALAASSFGAGIGGSVWALVARGDAGTFAADWLRAYRVRFPHAAARAEAFAASPGPSLTALGEP